MTGLPADFHERVMREYAVTKERRALEHAIGPDAPTTGIATAGWKPGLARTMEKSMEVPEGGRVIHGLASTSTLNSKGFAVVARGMDAELPVPLLWGHTGHRAPLGEVFFIRRSDARIYVRARLFDTEAADAAWRKIETGEARCLSASSKASSMKLQGVVDGHKYYDRWTLGEVSIVRKGANPDCVFEIMPPGDPGVKFLHLEVKDLAPQGLQYKGVYRRDATYMPGDFVSHGGSLWHANIQSRGGTPGTSPLLWKLAVKRGRVDTLEK